MKVNFNSAKQGANRLFRKGRVAYQRTVKPGMEQGFAKAKTMANDTVSFVKKNPTKTGKYAAFALGGLSAIALAAAGIKNIVRTYKQNKILKEAVVTQRATINDLKEIAATNALIVEGQNKVIAEMKK